MKNSRFNLFAPSSSINRAACVLTIAITAAMPSAQAVEKVWGGVGSTTTTVTFNSASNWDGGVAPNGSIAVDTVAFGTTGNIAPELNSATRSVLGFTFNAGANAFTFGSTFAGGNVLSIGSSGIANNATSTQTFGSAITVVVGASHTWNTVAGGILQLDGIVDLSNSPTSRNLIIAGAGTTNVSNTIRNSFANTNTLSVTSTGTTTLSGNNTYSGLTTMNAAGGTLILSGNNSAAIGGVTLTAGTLNVKNANALGTGAVSLASASVLDNTSSAAITNLGNNPVTWGTNSTTAVIFGTGASTSLNNLDLGTGIVTAGSSRLLTLAGTGTTLSMGTLNVTSNSTSGRTFTFNGAGNTAVLRGFNIAPLSPNAVTAELAGSANLTISGPIVNGSAFANGVEIGRTGLTIFSGTNTYSGLTKISNGTLQINGPAALASASTLNSGGSASDTSTLNLAMASAGYAMDSLSIGGIMRFTGPASGSVTLTFAGSGPQGFTGTAAEKKINVASAVNVVVNGSSFNLLGAAATANRNHTIQVDGSMTFNSVVEATGAAFTAGFSKTGAGVLTLNAANTYNGTTFAEAGILRLGNATAIPGGIADTGGTSALVLSGGAIIGLTPASGDFTRNISAAAFNYSPTSPNPVVPLPNTDVGWVSGSTGGFAAFGGARNVNFGGAGAQVSWSSGSGRFGSGLVLCDSTSDSTITVVNAISIGSSALRSVIVNDGSQAVDAILSGVVSGSLGATFVKNGTGTLALNGINTYLGDTQVLAGVLAVNGTSIADANKLIIDGGKVDLTGAETVNTLFFGAAQQAAGTYSATGAGGTIASANFTGSGTLIVTTSAGADTYTVWANSFGLQNPWLGVTASLNGTPTADPDNDGVTNQTEYAFGLIPNSGASVNPIISQLDKTTGLFTYSRRLPSLTTPTLVFAYEYSTTLSGAWTPFTPDSTTPSGVSPVEQVIVDVPNALLTNPKLFVRVSAR